MITSNWKKLNHLQIGKYAEYYVKMALTQFDLDVYSAEVDDKGIDFVIRKNADLYYEIQVKSIRGMNYVFFPKDKFELRQNLYAAVVVFLNDQTPELFLINSTEWLKPNSLFVDRRYEGKKSNPEWGLNISKKNWFILEQYAFDKVALTL